MGENSKIEWCHHTFNPWIGCQKVSPGCDHCYAEAMSKRRGWAEWGPHGERKRTSIANWRKPLQWAKAARLTGERPRVFCASLADVFDNQAPDGWRSDLFALIEDTPELDWLLLTKRPQNIAKMLWAKWDSALPRHIWLGTTCEDRERYEQRWPHLRAIPAAIRFISYEPALGPLSLFPFPHPLSEPGPLFPDMVICGGESGGHARPMHPDWARSIRDECAHHGVAFFFKQHGEWREPVSGEFYNTLRGLAGKPPAFIMEANGNVHCTGFMAGMDRAMPVLRVGKKAAGRLLDGRTHDEMPA